MFHSPAGNDCRIRFAQTLVGRADARAAAFASVIEGVLVDFLGRRIVNDVASLDARRIGSRSQVSIQNASVRTISFWSSVIEPDTSIM